MPDVHTGHRARLTARALSPGLDHMPAHEALEFLLFFALPRGDVNPLAHELINAFGSVGGVLKASEAELTAFPGLGANAARYLTALGRMMDAYCGAEHRPESLSDAALNGVFARAERGDVTLLFLNTARQVLSRITVTDGTAGREAVRTAVLCDAAAVFAAVNAPAGPETLTAALNAEEALATVGIPLIGCTFNEDGEIRYLGDEWGTDR